MPCQPCHGGSLEVPRTFAGLCAIVDTVSGTEGGLVRTCAPKTLTLQLKAQETSRFFVVRIHGNCVHDWAVSGLSLMLGVVLAAATIVNAGCLSMLLLLLLHLSDVSC